MSTERPTIAPDLLAAMIESTPDRVRRRLDQSPDAASTWEWRAGETHWVVEAGGETVALPHGLVAGVDQIRCSCLLSPRCFHVLACLTQLKVGLVEPAAEAEDAPAAAVVLEGADDLMELEEAQRRAAGEMAAGMAAMLRVGVASGGVVVHSSILRAVHQCRVNGLHRLAALGVRVVAGAGEIRARSASADPAQLAEDAADLLETCRHVLRGKPVAEHWIGTARRRQAPVRPRRLHGLFAEPVITRSGFAGATAYLLGEDGRIYTASDVRPGGAQEARDAYFGGIEIGPMVRSAKQLARGLYLGTDLTASRDGRLGRGKGVRIVEEGASSWRGEAIEARFRRPAAEQWGEAYSRAVLASEGRPADWDLVFFEGMVLGAAGPELLVRTMHEPRTIRLAIENESDALRFRENLRLLSHAPGLRLRIVARVRPLAPWTAAPLAVVGFDDESADGPRLALPDSWSGRACLGFDELQRHHLVNAQASPSVLSVDGLPHEEDPFGPLRRRWIAKLLSGVVSQAPRASSTLARETAALGRLGLGTGAGVLDALTRAPSKGGPTDADTFLAAAVYLRHAAHEWARSRGTSAG